MISTPRLARVLLFATTTALIVGAASAQVPQADALGAARSFTPADFARFAPRSAYDMLTRVPSFTIRVADQERGLGQASENVLLNGQRIANKSGGAIEELKKISIANVRRIDIVDAATLGIAGLTGPVANVIAEQKAAGQFEWRPDFRAHYSRPNLFRGSVSYSGESGPLGYTFALKDDAGRGAFGGPVLIYAPSGTLTERRDETYHSESDTVTLSGRFTIKGPGTSVGHLLLGYSPYWGPSFTQDSRQNFVTLLPGARQTASKLAGWYYDVNADYEFALGPGRLKLIGVRHFDHEPITTTQLTTTGPADDGVRFGRDSHIGETVGRAEYGWHSGKGDWQLSLERAYNILDQHGTLSQLAAGGAFVPVAYPQGSGTVAETRYEAIATYSRPLGPTLDLQLNGGGEISRLARVDGDLPARKFFRPKGSATLGWRPARKWDLSLTLRRRVGQISFYDFLAQPKLSDDRANAGNPALVPPQSWEAELQVGRDLGAWGKTRLRTYYHRITDIVDIVPLPNASQGVGNLPHAARFGAESTNTVQFDPLGWKGARLDLTLGFEHTNVRDPLTHLSRPISGTHDRWVDATFRHDVPGTPLAWGAAAGLDHYAKNYYPTEVYRSWEGPWFVNIFAEHKNLLGMTMRATIANILDGRHLRDRFVYTGFRNANPLAFHEVRDQLIGPIFTFSIKGNF